MRRAGLPLILLPGTLCDERVFSSLLQHLPGVESHVIGTAHARTVQQAARHVLSQAPESFALLGFSLGGMVALEIASQAPARVRGLALVSTSPLPVPEERHAVRRAAVELAGTMTMEAFACRHLWPDYRGKSEWSEHDSTHRRLVETMAMDLGQDAWRNQTEMAINRPDYRASLKSIRCPALVTAGDEDRLCPPEVQEILHRGLNSCTLVLIRGAGHLALLQRPDEMGRAVAAWFDTVLQQGDASSAGSAARQESE